MLILGPREQGVEGVSKLMEQCTELWQVEMARCQTQTQCYQWQLIGAIQAPASAAQGVMTCLSWLIWPAHSRNG